MKCRAPTWWSWTKRAAKGALCQVVFGRYMPMSSPVCVGIAQWAATSRAAATATPIAIGITGGAGSSIQRRGGRSSVPTAAPTTIAASSTHPGR